MNHTPGPWRTDDLLIIGKDCPHNEYTVAEAKPTQDPAVARANAGLIAAAPQLYSALKLIVEKDFLDIAWEQAIRALEKAEGKG